MADQVEKLMIKEFLSTVSIWMRLLLILVRKMLYKKINCQPYS